MWGVGVIFDIFYSCERLYLHITVILTSPYCFFFYILKHLISLFSYPPSFFLIPTSLTTCDHTSAFVFFLLKHILSKCFYFLSINFLKYYSWFLEHFGFFFVNDDSKPIFRFPYKIYLVFLYT